MHSKDTEQQSVEVNALKRDLKRMEARRATADQLYREERLANKALMQTIKVLREEKEELEWTERAGG